MAIKDMTKTQIKDALSSLGVPLVDPLDGKAKLLKDDLADLLVKTLILNGGAATAGDQHSLGHDAEKHSVRDLDATGANADVILDEVGSTSSLSVAMRRCYLVLREIISNEKVGWA